MKEFGSIDRSSKNLKSLKGMIRFLEALDKNDHPPFIGLTDKSSFKWLYSDDVSAVVQPSESSLPVSNKGAYNSIVQVYMVDDRWVTLDELKSVAVSLASDISIDRGVVKDHVKLEICIKYILPWQKGNAYKHLALVEWARQREAHDE